MKIETFRNIAEKVPNYVAIIFSGMSEVFANSRCLEFLKIAVKMPNDIYLYTTLNGITPEAADYIARYARMGRFKKLVKHLPDAMGNMPGCRLTDNYWYALNTLGPLEITNMMTMSSNAEILEELRAGISRLSNKGDIIRKLPKERFVGWTRAGSLNKNRVVGQEMLPDVDWKCGISCATTPYYDHNVVLPDGRVVLCCMDYGLKHILGNITVDSYEQIVGGKEIAHVSACNMSLDPKVKANSICTKCHNVQRWTIKKDNCCEAVKGIPVKHSGSVFRKLVRRVGRLFKGL